MARKKKPPEHENLERWLVSYADFMTLIFATFVVLYALGQVDVASYTKMQDSVANAFAAPSLLQGAKDLLNGSGDSILDSQTSGDSFTPPLMMEYINPKYEQKAFEDIKQEIDSMGKQENIEANIDDRGLVIKISNSDILFYPGSAELTPQATILIKKLGKTIEQKFKIHLIKVEGHTDSTPCKSGQYPSNWELSSARSSSIIRYLISNFQLQPALFTAVGCADTHPVADNSTAEGKAKNRRVEIIIVRNKHKAYEGVVNSLIKYDKKAQEKELKENQQTTVNQISGISLDSDVDVNSNNIDADKRKKIKKLYQKEVTQLNDKIESIPKSLTDKK